jgi:DNA-binding transcriptional regulator YhcF (GntR family)
MGFKATDWAYGLDLGPSMTAVLAALAHRADDKTMQCFPGQDTLAAMTGTSRATVSRAMNALEDLGVITRSRRLRADGSRTSDLCTLNRSYASESNVAESYIAESNVAESKDLGITVQAPTSHSEGAIEDHSEDHSEEKPVNRSRTSVDYSTEFDEWWPTYPRHQGKEDALKAYKQARKTTDAKTLRDGAQAYTLLNIGVEKTYLKLPAGWIRSKRWEDEQIAAAPVERPAPTDPQRAKSWRRPETMTPTTYETRDEALGRFCPRHQGYPNDPCVACERDKAEGQEF